MKTTTTTCRMSATDASCPSTMVGECYQDLTESFERFCLMAGIESLSQLMEEDVTRLAGERLRAQCGQARLSLGLLGDEDCLSWRQDQHEARRGCATRRRSRRWCLPSWEEVREQNLLGQWAMNLMLLNVATRKFGRAVRPPQAGLPDKCGSGLSKSAVSRRFKALSQAKFEAWMQTDLSSLELVAIQIDGLHLDENLLMIGAVGIDVSGHKHPLGLIEGATENAATVQSLIDDLIARGLNPDAPCLFIVDGAKALSKAIRRTFGADTPIQRCQVHKARNLSLTAFHPSITRRCGAPSGRLGSWEDPDKAETVLRNLAQHFEDEAPDVARSILERSG